MLLYAAILTLFDNFVRSASLNVPAAGPVSTWPYQSFVTEPNFHPPVLDISKSGNVTDGLFFFSQVLPRPIGAPTVAPMIMTEAGDAVWHGPYPVQDPHSPFGTVYGSLAVQLLDGQEVLSYWSGRLLINAVAGYGVGVVKIFDSTYQEIHTVSLVDSSFVAGNGLDYPGQSYVDLHESLITSKGSIIVTAYNSTPYDLSSVGGPKNGWVNDNHFYEIDIKTNKTLFRWSSLDHVAQIPINQSMMVEENGQIIGGQSVSTPWEYLNLNSVTTLADGYLISARLFSSIYAIKKDGSVMWHLEGITGGDFALGPGAQFRYQHDVRVAYSSFTEVILTMFNNDNSNINGTNGTYPSTGLTLSLDLWNRKVTVVRALLDPKDIAFSPNQGSYQALSNGHTFLSYGMVAKWKEFDQYGNPVMTVNLGDTSSYRTYLKQWSAIPTHEPLVNATATGPDSTVVYMSWNGASPDVYDSWLVYAAGTDGHFSLAANVSRTGFETNATFRAAKFVQVAPVNGARVHFHSAVIDVMKF